MSGPNSPERKAMLAERRENQLSRARHPDNRFTARVATQTAFSPSINRHTGKPHKHLRAKARRLRQAA